MTVTIDDGLLRFLGTGGVSETVDAALAACVRNALVAFDVRDFDVTAEDIAAARA